MPPQMPPHFAKKKQTVPPDCFLRAANQIALLTNNGEKLLPVDEMASVFFEETRWDNVTRVLELAQKQLKQYRDFAMGSELRSRGIGYSPVTDGFSSECLDGMIKQTLDFAQDAKEAKQRGALRPQVEQEEPDEESQKP